jgi:DNA-binding GntR family transcriptional regulator
MNQSTASSADHLRPGGLRQFIIAETLRAIFRRELPAGSKLMVMRMAERFNTSSTPCREAIVELASLGVVNLVHNRGAEVAPFGPQELRNIYHIRRILESEATHCACGRIDEGQVVALRQSLLALKDDPNGPGWSDAATDADRQLHATIADHCGNPRLVKEIGRYETLIQTVREIIGNARPAQEDALQEHIGIVEALLREDADEASAEMARHVDSAARSAEAAMF